VRTDPISGCEFLLKLCDEFATNISLQSCSEIRSKPQLIWEQLVWLYLFGQTSEARAGAVFVVFSVAKASSFEMLFLVNDLLSFVLAAAAAAAASRYALDRA